MRIEKLLIIALIVLLGACEKSDDDDNNTGTNLPPSVAMDPVACFTANQSRSGEFEFVFKFNNCSENATVYSWDFGDGNSSSAISPSHVFENYGKYDVTLTVQNNTGKTDTYTFEVEYGLYKIASFDYSFDQANDASGLGQNCSFSGQLIAVQENGVYVCASNFLSQGENCTSITGNYFLSPNPSLVVTGQIGCGDPNNIGAGPEFSYFGYDGPKSFNLDEELVYNDLKFTSTYNGIIDVDLEFELTY